VIAVPGATRYGDGTFSCTICRIGSIVLTIAAPAGLVMNCWSGGTSGPPPLGLRECEHVGMIGL
jgi:hypothetical protein